MLQVTAHESVLSAASGNPCITSKSGIRVLTRKWCHCECDASGTANQLVVYGNQCINASSPIRAKKVSHDKYVTLNAPPLEPLYNRKSKAIYSLSSIHANNVSLDKGPDCEFTSTIIMTRRTSRMGRLPGKKNKCQQNNVSQTSATTET